MAPHRIYVYCIINAPADINETVGHQRIYSIPWRDHAAIVADLDAPVAPHEHMPAWALTHEQVVELMMQRFTVLPMRLLTVVADRAAVQALLQEHDDEFNANFSRLAHKAEYGLKVLWPAEQIKERLRRDGATAAVDESTAAVSPAALYMKNKFAAYTVEQAFQKEAGQHIAALDAFFSGVAVEKKLVQLPTEKMLLNAAYLVEQCRQPDVTLAFAAMKQAHPDLVYQFSGPWPPYNFIVLAKKAPTDAGAGMAAVLNKLLA